MRDEGWEGVGEGQIWEMDRSRAERKQGLPVLCLFLHFEACHLDPHKSSSLILLFSLPISSQPTLCYLSDPLFIIFYYSSARKYHGRPPKSLQQGIRLTSVLLRLSTMAKPRRQSVQGANPRSTTSLRLAGLSDADSVAIWLGGVGDSFHPGHLYYILYLQWIVAAWLRCRLAFGGLVLFSW